MNRNFALKFIEKKLSQGIKPSDIAQIGILKHNFSDYTIREMINDVLHFEDESIYQEEEEQEEEEKQKRIQAYRTKERLKCFIGFRISISMNNLLLKHSTHKSELIRKFIQQGLNELEKQNETQN